MIPHSTLAYKAAPKARSIAKQNYEVFFKKYGIGHAAAAVEPIRKVISMNKTKLRAVFWLAKVRNPCDGERSVTHNSIERSSRPTCLHRETSHS